MPMDPTLRAVLVPWNWRPDVLVMVGVLGTFYLGGWWRLRRRSARGVQRRRLLLYMAGLAAIGLALLSPIDTFASRLFSIHMVQHELLTMIAPPLLLLANPLPALLWALPGNIRRALGRYLARTGALRRAWWALTLMPVAWFVHVATLWGWHLSPGFDVALRNDLVHDLEHLSFFLTALLFWWPIVNPAPRLRGHVHHGLRIAYVVPSLFQSLALGAFFAFMLTTVRYPAYLDAPRPWGPGALRDQGFGGMIMMEVEGLIYLATALCLLARMLDHEEKKTALREAVELGLRDAPP